jgi:hypothetical protein
MWRPMQAPSGKATGAFSLGHITGYTTKENLPARLSRLKQDPWADIAKTKQSITAAMLKRLAAR